MNTIETSRAAPRRWSTPSFPARLLTGALLRPVGAQANRAPHSRLASFSWRHNFAAAATGQANGDGHTAGQEYVADTNPTNAASVLRVTSIVSGLPVEATFSSSSNRLYTLTSRTNAASGPWLAIPGQTDVPGTGGPLTLRDTNAPPPGCFYRIGVRLP